jgi:hypothetical protein
MTTRRLWMATCDVCKKDVEITEQQSQSGSYPVGWRYVVLGRESGWFCSVACACAFIKDKWDENVAVAPKKEHVRESL